MSAREKIDGVLDRIWPGMTARPLWMAVVSAACLTVYWHHGGTGSCPPWFVEWQGGWTGIESVRFHEYAWSHLSAVVILMVVPLVLCVVLERMKITEMGLGFMKAGWETLLVLGLWAAFLPVVWYVSRFESFQNTYPKLDEAEASAALYFAFEGYYLVKWMAWEFFFRGFMLFGFRKDLGGRAVLVSTIPFVLMHYGKPELEVFGSLFAGLILCWIALRSRSIWPGVLLHWLVASSMDFFASTWWR